MAGPNLFKNKFSRIQAKQSPDQLFTLMHPIVAEYLNQIKPSDEEITEALLLNRKPIENLMIKLHEDLLKIQANKVASVIKDAETRGNFY